MIVTVALPVELRADAPSRRIYGRALPYNTEATVSTGQTLIWKPGSIDLKGTPAVMFHDETSPVGKVALVKDNDDGQDVEIAISATHDGDDALVLATDEVLTGLSVGADLTEFTEDENGVITVTQAQPRHLALVVSPAYESARVSRVAAEKEKVPMPETPAETPAVEAETPTVVPAIPRHPSVQATMPSPGEALFAIVRRRENPAAAQAMVARIKAAAPHTLFADVDGGTFSPLIGPVVDSFAPAERPVATAFGVRAAPSGVKSFIRPVINAHIDPAAAAAEKSDVTDGPLVVDPVTVTMTFLKRAANLSAEATVFTSIDVLNLAVNDLVRAYLHGFETKTVTDLAALATGTPIAIAADGTDAVAKLAAGAQAIYEQTYSNPDTLILSPSVWAKFVGFEGSDGRPLFPTLGPTNAPGQNTPGITDFGINVLGLRPVVSWSLAAGAAYLASSRFVEVYESSRIDMRVDEPTILGIALGIGGAQGFWIANGKAVVPITVA